MRITVVGTGNMGTAIATGLTAAGHQVVLTYSRDPDKPAAVAEQIGTGCTALPPARATVGADAVVLTVGADGLEPALGALGDLDGAVLISVTSGLALDPRGQTYGIPTGRTQAAAETVAELVPAAHVVQALSTTFAPVLATRADHLLERPTIPLCGDDQRAKRTAGDIVTALGCDPLDLGGLQLARALETFATASAQLALAAGRMPHYALRLLIGTTP